MLHAMAHVVPSHLMDRNLYPFATLQATGVADPMGDKAFDDDDDLRHAPSVAPLRAGAAARFE
jgi:tRNA 2-thiocytidine biosynthesis protein TtcA